METMSVLGVRPDKFSLGLFGFLYALKGLQAKIFELDTLMDKFGRADIVVFFSKLISGYMKSGNLGFVSVTILSCLKEGDEKGMHLS